jgi:imidazolonepropionase-like amidohydrolase
MIVFTNADIFDGSSKDLLRDKSVVVADGKIKDVSDAPIEDPNATVIDCGGRVLMPGMIDAHIHAYFQDVNMNRLQRLPATMYAHHAANILRDMLDRGFTSVRDTGGADFGLWLAIDRRLITAPRLYYCEKALSQTGGHIDMRHHLDYSQQDNEAVMCGCCFTNPLGVIVDGVDAVRRVIREQLRRGASFIKFCGSGGVGSVSDPLDGIQFSRDEVRAIVEEVENHHVYCTAHVHPDQGIKRVIELGVHGVEHGTLIEADTANMAADKGTYIVPTLAVIFGMADEGEAMGLPRESLAKLELIADQAIDRLNHMKRAGVRVGFGTDLIGDLHPRQCTEFGLRSSVFSNLELLNQVTAMNGEIVGQKDKIGVIKPGALADILVVDGNPMEDIDLLARDGEGLSVIMKDGEFHKNLLS